MQEQTGAEEEPAFLLREETLIKAMNEHQDNTEYDLHYKDKCFHLILCSLPEIGIMLCNTTMNY